MKIGIFGSVYVNVKIQLEGEFDRLGSNEGHAVTCYSSPSVELAKLLSADNEVLFLTSLGTEAEVYIRRLLKKYNINPEYSTYQLHGTGFYIEFENGDERPHITGVPNLSSAIENIKLHEEAIFNNLDVMVTGYLDEDVINLCKKHKVPVYLLEDEGDVDLECLDDSDADLLRGMETITLANAVETLSNWAQLSDEKKRIHYDLNELTGKWEGLIESIDDIDEDDYEELKHLIFDTYHYFKNKAANDNLMTQKELLMYKYAGQAQYYFSEWTAGAENITFADFLQGLCYVIEKGFDVGYGKNPLPLGLTMHTPAGGADPEADMTSFETFEKSFEDNVKMLREDYEMD